MRGIATLAAALGLVAGMTAVSVFGRTAAWYTPAMPNLIVLFGMPVIVIAGWVSVARFGYRLRWVALVGVLLSLGSHWSLPLAHDAAEIPLLVVVNTAIFAVLSLLGGSAALAYGRIRQRRDGSGVGYS